MRVQRGGVSLHVTVDGPTDGPPVVFLHGVSGSALTYDWLPARIVAGRRVLRADLRGHGRSDPAPGAYGIDEYAADVAQLLRDVAGRPAALVGHSLGGVVAWAVAQRHPELVTAAFLEDPPLYMGEPDEHERNAAVPVFRAVLESVARWHEQGIDAVAAAQELAASPYGPDDRTMGDVMAADALAARADALLRMDPGVVEGAADRSTLAGTDTTAPVSVPVFLLAADDALSAFPVHHQERLARTHPDVEVVRLQGASHSIHDERAYRGEYAAQLGAFLARCA